MGGQRIRAQIWSSEDEQWDSARIASLNALTQGGRLLPMPAEWKVIISHTDDIPLGRHWEQPPFFPFHCGVV